jgi:hypothetical protein
MKSETYKISASLLNSWIYYKENPSKDTFDSFVDGLKGIFTDNKWTIRGKIFESEVAEGKHGKLSKLIAGLSQQKWSNKTITVDGLNIKISGKLDAVDYNKKRIYDIKRVDKFSEDKYDTSVQHNIYFYLNPDIVEFYYLVASGIDDASIELNIIQKLRPSDNILEAYIYGTIHDFFEFLKEKDLFNTYLEYQKAKPKGEYKIGKN